MLQRKWSSLSRIEKTGCKPKRQTRLEVETLSQGQKQHSLRKGYARKAILASSLGLSLFSLIAVSNSDVLDLSARNLTFHMTVEHSIFFATGAISVEIVFHFLKPARRLVTSLKARYVVIGLIISAALLAIWHYPLLFAAASFDVELHQLQHASFIMTGAIGYFALRSMPVAYLILFVMLIGAAMGLFGALLAVSSDQIFFPYSRESQVEAGDTMIILAIVMAVAVLPAILITHSLRHELRHTPAS